MSTLHMKLTRDQKRKLKKLAEDNDSSVSELVRDWIDTTPVPVRGETRDNSSRTTRRA